MFERQIAAGMAWLDAEYPGWEAKIKLKDLHLGSYTICVLGQLFGEFDQCPAIRHMEDGDPQKWDWTAARGFSEDGYDYTTLTAEWRAAILARRNKPAPARTATPAVPSGIATLCLR